MPDVFDHASEVEAQTLLDQLEAQAVRASLVPKAAPSGECQNIKCGELFPAGDPRLFCGAKCAAEQNSFLNHQRNSR